MLQEKFNGFNRRGKRMRDHKSQSTSQRFFKASTIAVHRSLDRVQLHYI